MPGSSKWLLSLSYPNQNQVCTPIRTTCLPHLIRDFIARVIFGEEYFYEAPHFVVPCYLLPRGPKYHHPISKHPQPFFLPQYERPSLTPMYNNEMPSVMFTAAYVVCPALWMGFTYSDYQGLMQSYLVRQEIGLELCGN